MEKRVLEEQLVSVRRQIHRYPELGNQEFKTTELLQKVLKAAGIAARRPGKTGLVALIKGTKKTQGKERCFAMRGDIDALPIHEKTGKSYASTRPGIMHACGHDANCTMVLGAALLLQERRNEFSGTVKFLFQPNEESSGGALDMIAAKVLKQPTVDAITGIHVSPWLPVGVVGLKENEMMAAVDRFTIDIIGDGGHGAYPHLTKDAIIISSYVVQALQSIVAREIDPVDPAVLTIGSIQGGERYNIVAGRVKMVGTVRTLSEKLHRDMPRLIERKLKHITTAYGADYALNYEVLGHCLRNDPHILALCRDVARKTVGAANVRMLEKPSMGGEDFSEYLRFVPGCFIYIGAAGKQPHPWHHERFDIDEKVLPIGAHLMADVALRYLSSEKR